MSELNIASSNIPSEAQTAIQLLDDRRQRHLVSPQRSRSRGRWTERPKGMKGSQASKRHERSTLHSSQQPKPVLGFPVLRVSYAQMPSLEIVSWALHGVLCLGERGSSGTTVLLTLRVSRLLSQISNIFLCSWLPPLDLILPHKTSLVFPPGKSHSFWVQLTV